MRTTLCRSAGAAKAGGGVGCSAGRRVSTPCRGLASVLSPSAHSFSARVDCCGGAGARRGAAARGAPPLRAATEEAGTAELTGAAPPKAAAPKDEDLPTEATLHDMRTSVVRSVPYEYDYWVKPEWVDGHVPTELEGTYLRNGSGLVAKGRHPFDGDGQVVSFSFRDGAVFFRNRFVKTKGFVEEQAAGRPLFRSSFTRGSPDGSPLFNPLDMTFKNVANTGVLPLGGKLYALYEAGLPHELDLHTLETVGESTLSGQVTGRQLAAHYRIVDAPSGSGGGAGGGGNAAAVGTSASSASTSSSSSSSVSGGSGGGKRVVTFAADSGPGGVTVTFFEFDEAGRRVGCVTHKLGGSSMSLVHDLAVTDNYYVLVLGSTKMDMPRFATSYLFGRSSIAECIKFDADIPARVVLVPRSGSAAAAAARKTGAQDGGGSGGGRGEAGAAPGAVEADCPVSFFPFHHVNAYEDGDGRVVVHTAAWRQIDLSVNVWNMDLGYWTGGQRSELYEVVVDTRRGGKVESASRVLDDQTLEFPSVAPQSVGSRHTHMYCVGDRVCHPEHWGPLTALIKVSSEPAPAPGAAAAAPGVGGGGRGSGGGGGLSLSPSGHSSNGSSGNGSNAGGGDGGRSGAAFAPRWRVTGVQRWLPPPRVYLSEPHFVPRRRGAAAATAAAAPEGASAVGVAAGADGAASVHAIAAGSACGAEDDGWLLVTGVDAAADGHGLLYILDAADVAAGPVATLRLPHALPLGLHGAWLPDCLGPQRGDAKAAQWREVARYRTF